MIQLRKYLILPVSEILKIDFSEVCETSEETLRISVDGLKTFVKWSGEAPVFLDFVLEKEGPYTHGQMLSILSSENWLANDYIVF